LDTNFTGNAGSATLVSVSGTIPAAVYNIPVCSGTGSGQQLRSDLILQYDTTVSPPNITSDLNGNAATASRVNVTNDATTASALYPVFASSPVGNKTLSYNLTTNYLTYIPSTGTLTVNNLISNVRRIRIGTGGGFFGFGSSTADFTNVISGNNNGNIAFNANTNNTIYGSNIGASMNVAAANNTLIGHNAGNAMTNTSQNTVVGSQAGDLITTGTDNTIIGYNAGSSIITGTNNTIIGSGAGTLITGSSNICIGSGATVPVVANSNQIVLGGTADTVFIQGGFRFKDSSAAITGTSTLPLAPDTILASNYIVNIAAAGQTVTLPDPANYEGQLVMFKRKTNNVQYTLASGGIAPRFIPLGTITAANTITVTTAIFQQIFFCDGTHWCEMSRT